MESLEDSKFSQMSDDLKVKFLFNHIVIMEGKKHADWIEIRSLSDENERLMKKAHKNSDAEVSRLRSSVNTLKKLLENLTKFKTSKAANYDYLLRAFVEEKSLMPDFEQWYSNKKLKIRSNG